jgi:hypothetical protein
MKVHDNSTSPNGASPAEAIVLDEEHLDHVSGGKLPPGYAAVTLESGAIIIVNKSSGRQVFP